MSTPVPTSSYDGLLNVTSPNGELAVGERVKTVADAASIYWTMREADQASAMNRVQIQAILDGAPPYNPRMAARRGIGDIANVNFGFMEDALNLFEAPFNDLFEEEILFTTPTRYGIDIQKRQEDSQIIAEEFTKLISNLPGVEFERPNMVRMFGLHGVSIPYFPDTMGIEWETTSMGDFLIPRHVRAKVGSIEVACFVKDWITSDLYKFIKDPVVAEAEGWNVAAVKEQIKNAHVQSNNPWNPEQWEDSWKNNDIAMSMGRSKTVRAVTMLVTSLEGPVSMYIFPEGGSAENGTTGEFMFKKLNKYSSQSEAYTIMTDSVGTNGFYHGIRGVGYKLFEIVKQMNMLWSSFIDAIRMSSKLVIQPTSDNSLENLNMVHFGNYVVMPPNTQTVQWQMPNLQNTIIPGLNMMNGVLSEKVGRYTSEADLNQAKEQTRAEVMARVDQVAKLSFSRLNIFLRAFTRLGREQFRRVMRRDWTAQDRNGPEVLAFYAACKRRGVEAEAIHNVDLSEVVAVRPIGNGSAAARTAIYDRLWQVFPYMDEEGKNLFLRDVTRTTGGVTAADKYMPKIPGQRPPIDKKVAILENKDMRAGEFMQVEPNELHAVHIPEHLQEMLVLINQLMGMEITEKQAIPALSLIQEHTFTHLGFISPQDPRHAQWNQALQQTDEIITNGQRSLEKKMKEQAEAEAAGQEYQASPDEVGVAERIQLEQAAMALDNALKEQKLNINEANQNLKVQETEQKMALRDAEVASKIRNQRRKPSRQ
jgi:hypothetical protein